VADRPDAPGPGDETFDYIVVGGGSAGCVLASRLSEDTSKRVLLLEAGPDRETFWMRTPAGLPFLFFDPAINWCYQTEAEPNLAGRRIYWPRGKVIGGSGAINGMLHMRGNPADYDGWAGAGNIGWSYADVLPFFKRSESFPDGDSQWRGHDGPLAVTISKDQRPITRSFVEAAQQAGHRLAHDFNGPDQEGVGYTQLNILGGRRSSPATAYLARARRRSNLTIQAGVSIQQVLAASGRACEVTGLQGGAQRSWRARREIILAAGTVATPHILMRSGIGRAEDVLCAGATMRVELPGVGGNLQDHLGINAIFEVVPNSSMNRELSGWRKYVNGLRYLLNRTGPLAMGAAHAQGFVRGPGPSPLPEVQLSFRPWSFTFEKSGDLRLHDFPGIQMAGQCLQPRARGRIVPNPADPAGAPLIRANYLAEPEDGQTLVHALKLIRRIAKSPALAAHVVREVAPGPATGSDRELLDYVRGAVQSNFHPVGTCRMGTDSLAVVDSRLRVHGLQGLRIADASVMPSIVRGNPHAAVVMIAEKAAAMVAQDARELL